MEKFMIENINKLIIESMEIETTNEIYKSLNNTRWFSNIGVQINDNNVGQVKSFDKACKYWKSDHFEEARSIAWEQARKDVPKERKDELRKHFDAIKKEQIKALKNSEEAQNVIEKCDENTENFALKLPHLGALMEVMSDRDDITFFSDQLKYFYQGKWVCYWIGKLNPKDVIKYNDQYLVY